MLFWEIWAGTFYLLNKIFFLASERDVFYGRRWQKLSWIFYLMGLPAWVIFFMINNDWIAASVELSGLPSMVLALISFSQTKKRFTRTWDIVSIICIVVGLRFSIYKLDGLSQVTQFLELGVAIGFLVGTYLLAKQKNIGYIFFMFMNLSCAILMVMDGSIILVLQQIVSLALVMCAYIITMAREKNSIEVLTMDNRTIRVSIRGEECRSFGFLHGTVVKRHDGLTATIVGVAPGREGKSVLWYEINHSATKGRVCYLSGEERNLKKCGWKQIAC